MTTAADDDLDFTKPSPPGPPPPPEKVANARQESSRAGPHLATSGFYVATARKSAGHILPRDGVRHAILVIEDDMDILKLVGEVLAGAGFAARFARTRAEINAEFNGPPLPDLVLLDVRLPDADGFNILEKIRGSRKLGKVPVIMMTGRSEPVDIARGFSLGADGYVTKPFKISGLVCAVNTVLGLDQPAS